MWGERSSLARPSLTKEQGFVLGSRKLCWEGIAGQAVGAVFSHDLNESVIGARN